MRRRNELALLGASSAWYVAVATRLTGGLTRRQFANGAYAHFFDHQAERLLDGHLTLAKGALGLEAFIVHGHEQMYFGLFPALLRMPILAFSDGPFGKLTLLSSLLAWVVFVVSAWALTERLLASLGRPPTWLVNTWKVTIAIGSPMLMLAGPAWVFSEAIMWGIAATTLFQYRLLCELQQSSWGNRIWVGVALLIAALNRPTHAVGCLIVLVAVIVGRAVRARRWDASMAWLVGAAAIGLAALVVPNWARFGRPFGLPMEDQLLSQVEPYRQQMLGYAGNDFTDPRYGPTNLLAYARPDGIHVGTSFPYITAPTRIPRLIGGPIYDITNRTPSLTASAPLLVGLAAGGLVAVARVARRRRWTPVIALAAVGVPAAATTMVWGFITPRYLADFIPLVLPLAVAGLAALGRRLTGRRKQIGAVVVAALAAWSVAANTGLALEASYYTGYDGGVGQLLRRRGVDDPWARAAVYQSVEDFAVDRYHPPAPGTLAVLAPCAAIYLSNGEPVDPWLVVDYGQSDYRAVFRVTLTPLQRSTDATVALATLIARQPPPGMPGNFTVTMVTDVRGATRLDLEDDFGTVAYPLDVDADGSFELAITSDPVRRVLSFDIDGRSAHYGYWQTRALYEPAGQIAHFVDAAAAAGVAVEQIESGHQCR